MRQLHGEDCRVTIAVVGDSIPSVPEDFQKRLRAFDPDLYVVWHKSPHTRQPGRWKIERCTRHRPDGGPHSHICVRVYILMCQDDEGTPKPLGDWVFEKLREMRANWEALGGDTERGVRNALALSNGIDQALEAKRDADSEDVKIHNSRSNKRQLTQVYDLIARHDLRVNR